MLLPVDHQRHDGNAIEDHLAQLVGFQVGVVIAAGSARRAGRRSTATPARCRWAPGSGLEAISSAGEAWADSPGQPWRLKERRKRWLEPF